MLFSSSSSSPFRFVFYCLFRKQNTMSQNAAFEQAIKITPRGSHRYSAVLQDDWCIGTGISPVIYTFNQGKLLISYSPPRRLHNRAPLPPCHYTFRAYPSNPLQRHCNPDLNPTRLPPSHIRGTSYVDRRR